MKISVIIPALNEAALIGRRLKGLRESEGAASVELIVVDGGSLDETVPEAEKLADRVILSPVPGRGAQMHRGAQAASGEILLFVHADTELPRGWNDRLREAFLNESPAPVAAAFGLSFDSDRFPYKIIEKAARVRNRITGVPQGDQGLAVRKEAYFRCGGFPDVPLMEEYFFLPRLKRLGKIKMLSGSVKTSARKYEKVGPFRNALLNLMTVFLFYAGVPPRTLDKLYRAR